MRAANRTTRASRIALVALGALVVTAMALAASCSTGVEAGAGTGSTGGAGSSDGDRLQVVATTSILADFARQVGGDRVDVYTVIKPNVDAHDFEPAPADIEALADADVILRNGVGLEEWFDQTVDSAQPSGVVVDTSAGVTLRERSVGGSDGGSGGEGSDGQAPDPHIWQSPANARIMVDGVERAFVSADPDGASTYEANAAAYDQVLADLDASVSQQLAGLGNRRIVTNHDALGYYIDRYHLEFVGSIIPSFDSTAELSAADIDSIVAEIRANGVKAVFSESSIPPKTAEAIGSEAGVTVVAGEDALYGDSLGPEGSGAATYVEMIQHNTEELVANLS